MTPSEPVPIGLAQVVYEGLSVLHYEGSINTTEQEVSGTVGLNNTLNLSGTNNAAWATMNAQVQEIAEDVDFGKTTLSVGPPKHLSAAQLVDWIRALRGRIQAEHLNQQQTGQAAGGTTATGSPSGDNVVQGPGDTSGGGVTMPPGGSSSSSPRNLFVSNASTGSTPGITVTPGAYNGSIIPTINGTPINAATAPVLQLNSSDTVLWLEISYNSSNQATSVLINHGTTIPTPTIVQGTAGTDYYGLSTVTVTVTAGKASVTALNDYLSGNQGYAQCGNASNSWLM
jgi:hypothetical protein